MQTSLADVRQKAMRSNHEQNRRTMFFSARVSIYVTWLLAGTQVTANQVTVVFTIVGVLAAAMVYLPEYWAPMAGFLLYRIHVVLDVVDGELARYRNTRSAGGAYLDFLTHYFVYSTASFGLGAHAYVTGGGVEAVFCGFAIAVGTIMNLASRDCWYRANYSSGDPVEGGDPPWRGSALTIVGAKLFSINTFWFCLAVSAAVEGAGAGLLPRFPAAPTRILLVFYAATLPVFALARALVTARGGRIPRRAAWYRKSN